MAEQINQNPPLAAGTVCQTVDPGNSFPEGEIDVRNGIYPGDQTTQAAVSAALCNAFSRLSNCVEATKQSPRKEPAGSPVSLSIFEDATLAHEAFRLEIADGKTHVYASNPAGHRYGIHALARLVLRGGGRIGTATITDGPALPVRGVCLDVGRRYWQKDTLLRVIDDMAWRGLNRLQLYLTEWNAFRLRLDDERFVHLAADDHYTSAELNELIRIAHQDGIDVSVEVNLPAHCTALIEAEPLLDVDVKDAVLRDGSLWTGHPTSGWMIDVTRSEVRRFCAELLTSLVAEVKADFFHIGGDEWFEASELEKSPSLVAAAERMTIARESEGKTGRCVPADVVVDFLNCMSATVREAGGRAEIWSWWHEAGARVVVPSPDVAITAWGTRQETMRLIDAGYDVIASPEDTHYVTPRTAPGNLGSVNYVVVDGNRLLTEPLVPGSGEQLAVWADWAENEPDNYFEWYAALPLQIFAARAWTGPTAVHLDAVVLDADHAQTSPHAQAIQGRTARIAPGQRFSAVRVHPAKGHAVESRAGKWSAESARVLDRWRGTVVEIADSAENWRPIYHLERQLPPTWMTFPLKEDGAVAARIRWDGPDQPSDDQIEWLIVPASGNEDGQ